MGLNEGRAMRREMLRVLWILGSGQRTSSPAVWSVSDVSCSTGVRLRIFLFLLTADGLSRTALLQVDSLYSYTRVFTNVHQHFVLTHDFLFFKLNFIKAFLKYFLDRLV